MREIKFRAITCTSGTLVYGHFAKIGGRSLIFNADGKYDVNPETVGQFTGRHDRNAEEIYENDIIDAPNDKSLLISWNEKYVSFCLDKNGWMYSHWFSESVEPENCEIVGNIHANPELVEANNEK